MQLLYRRSFVKDLKKIRSKKVRQEVAVVLASLEQSVTLSDVQHIKRLSSDGPYYRVRIGDYRLGMVVEDDTITIVRFLHRREIYRYFP